jgi:hypothetical protein
MNQKTLKYTLLLQYLKVKLWVIAPMLNDSMHYLNVCSFTLKMHKTLKLRICVHHQHWLHIHLQFEMNQKTLNSTLLYLRFILVKPGKNELMSRCINVEMNQMISSMLHSHPKCPLNPESWGLYPSPLIPHFEINQKSNSILLFVVARPKRLN